MQPQAVIFDIGNVLIEWQPERYYDRVYGEEMRRRLFSTVDLHGMNDEIDRGGDFREIIYATADRFPDFADHIRDWHDRWIELATPTIPKSLSLMRALRSKGIPVYCLSNFGVDSFAFAETQYPFLSEFDRRYISGHMQVTKPDPRIYEMVEADCGFAPATLLFTDDRPENIEAAQARGWQTHLFDGPEGWARRLVNEGLLSAAEAA